MNKQGTIDKFKQVRKKPKEPAARVSMTVGQATDYGALKVSATVSLECDQNEETINEAAGLCWFKAVELMADGWKDIDPQ